jgi:hypothetical protein
MKFKRNNCLKSESCEIYYLKASDEYKRVFVGLSVEVGFRIDMRVSRFVDIESPYLLIYFWNC